MSLPRYPTYKDSGVEWLGEVPGHWGIRSFRHCLSELFNGLTSTQVDEGEATVPVTRIETISTGAIDESRLGFISNEDVRVDRRLRAGDILFSNINSLNMIGNCAIYIGGREIYAGMNLLVLRPTSDVEPKWLYWLVRSGVFREVVESLAKPAINQASVSQSSLKSIGVPVPVNSEQAHIATFLDRETAKIDALVAEQLRLITLLKEKRQAVISHAVTKGLNPDAPMKDSGIEWLGEVPGHWEVRRVKTVSGFTTSGPRGWSERITDDGSIFVQSGDLTATLGIAFSECKRVDVGNDAETTRTRLRSGDVVVCITGAKTGNVAVATDVPEDAYVNQHLCLIRPNADVSPQFLGTLLKSDVGQTYFELSQYGLKQGLSLEDVREAPVPLPPLSEQHSIVELLLSVTSQFDRLTAEAQRAIDLLQERRTALISAAVTGQIDVRPAAERGSP